MKAPFQSGVLVWLLLISGGALSDSSTGILPTDDWSAQVTQARRSGLPILILFSREHCGYCERLKSEVLEPLAKSGEMKNFAWIRELDINRGGKIRDFDGEKIRTKIFVDRYEVYATPTLIFVDNQGKPLGTPIVGFNDSEDYTRYLEYFMDVSYWEPKKLESTRDDRLAASSLDKDQLGNSVSVTQIGDAW
jgi:thioredoxin-related protein